MDKNMEDVDYEFGKLNVPRADLVVSFNSYRR